MYNPFKPGASGSRFLGLAWPGAALGLAAVAILFPVYGGVCLASGLGTILDVLGGLLFGILALLVATPLIMLGLAGVRRIPLRFAALVVMALLCLVATGWALEISPSVSIRLGLLPMLLLVLAGAGLSMLRRRDPARTGTAHAIAGSFLLLAAVIGSGALLYWLATPGNDPFLKDAGTAGPRSAADEPNVPSPLEKGSYEVATLCYGSGTDLHRPQYGEKVDLKADPVDASALLAAPKGFRAWRCRRYWGFEPNSLPRNARVWYPKDEGMYPLILITHGNRKKTDFSDAGYAYLGELLAGRGYIVASVDESFLNDGWFGDDHGVRGWLLLKHLELWRTWSEQQGNPFYLRVDLMNIALIGHSRGGEAIVHAATFNGLSHHPDDVEVPFKFGFDIKTLIALAPTDGQYFPRGQPVPSDNVNYLVLQGSHDSDLGCFPGMAAYQRVMPGRADYRMKAALYIHRANHSQFNSDWGNSDLHAPLRYLLNRSPLLAGGDQRTIARLYVSAFLDATLGGKYEYIPMFRDHCRAAHWLPDTRYVSRFRDSDFIPVSDFDRSLDATKTSLPGGSQYGEHLQTRQVRELIGRRDQPTGTHALFLGWDVTDPAQVPTYTIALPEALQLGWWLDEGAILSFCLGDTGERCERVSAEGSAPPGENTGNEQARTADPNYGDHAPIDLTLELVAAGGIAAKLPLSHVRPLPRAIPVTLSKWPRWEKAEYKASVEPVLQTFEIPLGDFVKNNPDFDPGQLRQIRFRFDRTTSGVVILDEVGLARNRYASFAP